MQEKSDTPSVKGKNYADFSRDELIAEINRLKRTKKYGLVWEHKKEEVIENFKAGQQPYLKEVEDKRIENAPGEPTNLIIEGDNFDALSVLNYTHAGKIDVIYIDPPYNTLNRDFIYDDYRVEPEDDFRHSKWVDFMYSRLLLAKKMLATEWVVYISIDDNEYASLRLICDEIFGRENFCGNIDWESKTKSQNTKTSYRKLQPKVEYILCYASDGTKHKFNLYTVGEKIYDKEDEQGPYREYPIELMNANGIRGRETMVYEIEGIRPPKGKQWKLGQDQVANYKSSGNLFVRDNKAFVKMRPEMESSDKTTPFWGFYDKSIGTAESAKAELNSILKFEHGFDTVKPVDLIKSLLFHSVNKESIVLDFFAGSGTTGQAVMELNEELGQKHRFILCTDNGDKENKLKIAEEITYPRIKTIITGKRQDGSKYSDGIPANLRYYEIEHEQKLGSNDANRLEMSNHMEDILQIKENAFEEVKSGKVYKLYKNSEKYLCLAFDAFEMEKIIEKIAEENKEKLDTVIYSFSYSRDAFEDDYETDFNIEFKAMPEGLLKTYLNITESLRSED